MASGWEDSLAADRRRPSARWPAVSARTGALSSGWKSVEVHAADERLKAGVGTKVVEPGVDIHKRQVRRMLVELGPGFAPPLEAIPQPGRQQRHADDDANGRRTAGRPSLKSRGGGPGPLPKTGLAIVEAEVLSGGHVVGRAELSVVVKAAMLGGAAGRNQEDHSEAGGNADGVIPSTAISLEGGAFDG